MEEGRRRTRGREEAPEPEQRRRREEAHEWHREERADEKIEQSLKKSLAYQVREVWDASGRIGLSVVLTIFL